MEDSSLSELRQELMKVIESEFKNVNMVVEKILPYSSRKDVVFYGVRVDDSPSCQCVDKHLRKWPVMLDRIGLAISVLVSLGLVTPSKDLRLELVLEAIDWVSHDQLRKTLLGLCTIPKFIRAVQMAVILITFLPAPRAHDTFFFFFCVEPLKTCRNLVLLQTLCLWQTTFRWFDRTFQFLGCVHSLFWYLD